VEWFFDPWLNTGGEGAGLYGISFKNTNSIIFPGDCMVWRQPSTMASSPTARRGGIDMDKVQTEIPVE
jgi:hypothetical protein